MPEKQKYIIKGSDFRFQKKTYPEGSAIELTEEQYKEEGKRIDLIPVNNEEVPGKTPQEPGIESGESPATKDEKSAKKADKKK